MRKGNQNDLLGRDELFGIPGLRSPRDRHPADVLGDLLKEIYGTQDCHELKAFLNGEESIYTEAGSDGYRKECDEKLRQWLMSDLVNMTLKSSGLKHTTFYPAAIHLITGSKYYFGAGGDILYQALFAQSDNSVLNETAERIRYFINALYEKPNIYRDVTSILNSGSIEIIPKIDRQLDFFHSPLCSYFAKIRRDVDLLLRLKIPDPLLTIRFLIVLLNFHLTQYVLRKCISTENTCEECIRNPNTSNCRPIVLVSFCNAVNDKSQMQYRRHAQIIRSRLADNIERNVQKLADKYNATSVEKILQVLADENNGFSAKLQNRSRFIKKMKEAELHINASPIKKVANAISRYYGTQARQLDAIARLYRNQGVGAGFVAPKRYGQKRYIMESDLLETLTYIGISYQGSDRLATDKLLDWWYHEYGFVIGCSFVNSQEELESLRRDFGREIDEELLHENYLAFEELLVKIKIMQKFSDATSMVTCRYEIEDLEDAN